MSPTEVTEVSVEKGLKLKAKGHRDLTENLLNES